MFSFSSGFAIGTGVGTTTAELYDPASASFSYTANLNNERDESARMVLLNSGFAMVIGGVRVYEIYRPWYWNTAEILNPTEPTFSISATLCYGHYSPLTCISL